MNLKITASKVCGSGFKQTYETKKLLQFQSSKSGRILYLYKSQGFPDHADVIVDPTFNSSLLLAIPNVSINKRVEFRYGSNMKTFPKKLNGGEKPEHYGRALYVTSEVALSSLCKAYL